MANKEEKRVGKRKGIKERKEREFKSSKLARIKID